MIQIINGPNLNLQGRRRPEIYGTQTFTQLLAQLAEEFPDTAINYLQSNSEGAIIDAIQAADADPQCTGIVINPGAYSHYSYAIADAIANCSKRVVEVHISNIHAREEFRRHSVTGGAASGVIAGFGLRGYAIAIQSLL